MRRIAHKSLSESFQWIFFRKCSAPPPPPKKSRPKFRPNIVGIPLQLLAFSPKLFTLIFCLRGDQDITAVFTHSQCKYITTFFGHLISMRMHAPLIVEHAKKLRWHVCRASFWHELMYFELRIFLWKCSEIFPQPFCGSKKSSKIHAKFPSKFLCKEKITDEPLQENREKQRSKLFLPEWFMYQFRARVLFREMTRSFLWRQSQLSGVWSPLSGTSSLF